MKRKKWSHATKTISPVLNIILLLNLLHDCDIYLDIRCFSVICYYIWRVVSDAKASRKLKPLPVLQKLSQPIREGRWNRRKPHRVCTPQISKQFQVLWSFFPLHPNYDGESHQVNGLCFEVLAQACMICSWCAHLASSYFYAATCC